MNYSILTVIKNHKGMNQICIKLIQELLVRRASLADGIGKIKESIGNKNKQIYRPERHIEVLKSINKRNKGNLSLEMISKIWNEIISIMVMYLKIQI